MATTITKRGLTTSTVITVTRKAPTTTTTTRTNCNRVKAHPITTLILVATRKALTTVTIVTITRRALTIMAITQRDLAIIGHITRIMKATITTRTITLRRVLIITVIIVTMERIVLRQQVTTAVIAIIRRKDHMVTTGITGVTIRRKVLNITPIIVRIVMRKFITCTM
jgi:hypothetical protein